jgi:hypothetical protein
VVSGGAWTGNVWFCWSEEAGHRRTQDIARCWPRIDVASGSARVQVRGVIHQIDGSDEMLSTADGEVVVSIIQLDFKMI